MRLQPSVATRRRLLALVFMTAAFVCIAGDRWPAPGAGMARAADAGPWLAETVQGNVRIRAVGADAGGWRPLEDAIEIAGDSEVATGANGIAVLANGIDRIELSPNSHLVLPAPTGDNGLLTRIRQKLGRVFFDVGPQPERRFEVEAPFLVVLVKGTQFTVRTNYIGNSVEVREGTVEARPAGGGTGTQVSAGETANIFAGGSTVTVGPSSGGAGGSSSQGKGGGDSRSGASTTRGSDAGPGDGDGNDGEGGGDDGGGDDGGGGGDDGDGGNGGYCGRAG